ncbi:DUF536 domain-containing protein [Mammaliicoccus sciuri]|uniref:DUF536 domain-containing protein n=1 Tax=Mammaliicoccus sciuri TaxID=1296 RepID=UPI003F57797F
MLTIKKLADKLGVSKQTVTNNKPDDMEFTKIKNTYHIDEELEKAITERILERKQDDETNKGISDTEDEKVATNEPNSELTHHLKSQIESLTEQLKEKDKQIDKYSKLLENQQILALKSTDKVEQLENKLNEKEQRLIEVKEETKSDLQENNQNDRVEEKIPDHHKQKKGLFSKWFK